MFKLMGVKLDCMYETLNIKGVNLNGFTVLPLRQVNQKLKWISLLWMTGKNGLSH